jgi:hypothetical protein
VGAAVRGAGPHEAWLLRSNRPARGSLPAVASRYAVTAARAASSSSAGIGLEGVRRILELENHVAALRARNAELSAQARELRAALDTALSALAERRPNLPVVRPRASVHPFGQSFGHPLG